MKKVATLLTLVLFVQLTNSSPISQTDEIEKSIGSLKFASGSGLERQVRQKRSDFETTPGLKCYHSQRENVVRELDCAYNEPTGKDLSAKYCATITGPYRTMKSCANKMISDAFQNIGLTSPDQGCVTKDDKTFCLCSGNLCNA